MKPIELMQKYWDNVTARGERPQKIYAVVHQPGSIQPPGYVQAWSLSKSAAERDQAKIQGNTQIVVVLPPEPGQDESPDTSDGKPGWNASPERE